MGQNPVDYDALAKQHGGTPDYDALAQAAGAQPAQPAGGGMNFAIVNGERVPVDDGPMDLVSGIAQNVNPLPGIGAIGRALIPQAAAEAMGAGPDQAKQFGPMNALQGALDAQNHVKSQADELWAQGDKVGALAKYAEWLIPFLGPAMSEAGDKIQHGQPYRGVGESIGLGLASAGEPFRSAGAVSGKVRMPALVSPTANPAMQDALALAERRGIPVDAATATGSQYVKAAQEASGSTPLGAIVEHRAQAARTGALRRVAGELVDEASPVPETPEGAGAAVRQAAADIEARRAGAYGKTADKLRQAVNPQAVSAEQAGAAAREGIRSNVAAESAYADDAYQMVRDIEDVNREEVPTAPRGSQAERRILRRMASNAEPDQVDPVTKDVIAYRKGVPPTQSEIVAMRQIEAELDAMPYSKGGVIPTRALSEEEMRFGEGTNNPRVQARGGAPVYWEIVDRLPRTTAPTRESVLENIRHTLETGEWTNEARAAWDIAKDMTRADVRASSWVLPEGAPFLGKLEKMAAPVELAPFRKAVQPMYRQLLRERQLNGSLMGDRGRILVALDKLMQGPEYASLSTVDAILGDLKGAARTDVPELRTQGQGVAAAAVKALEKQVRETADRIGALPALEEGRAGTVRKYQAGGVLEGMRDGNVNAFRQVVAPGDVNIEQLEAIAKRTPDNVPKVARALVDGLIEEATVDGAFTLDKAKALESKWNAIGDRTKRVLFTPGTLKRLDAFFSRARKASDSPFLTAREGDVNAYAQLVAARDTQIGSLRALQQVAPDAVPKIARAYLEGLMDRAQADGGFSRVAGLRADWNKLGPATKRVLFPKPGQVAELDQFFLLADKLQAPLNTSKTAIVGIASSSGLALIHPTTGVPVALTGYAVAKLLQSPAGVRALTRGAQMSVKGAQVTPAARLAAYGQILRAASAARVPVGVADSTNPEEQRNR